MTDFAKIIRASDGAQVLIFKDNGDEGPELVFMTELDGVVARLGSGFEHDPEEDAYSKLDKAFDAADVRQADVIRKAVCAICDR